MNLHKKLLSIGFKKCPFHKRDTNYIGSVDYMVIDDFEIKTEFINGIYKTTKIPKKRPKWDSFYRMKFTENLTVWIYTNQSGIEYIYLEGNRIQNGVERIQPTTEINSKSDIIKLLPKDVQRDITLNSIL